MKMKKFFAFCSMFVMLVSLMGVVPASAAPSVPPVIPDAALKAMFTTMGGADVLPTTRTVRTGLDRHLTPTMGSPMATIWLGLTHTIALVQPAPSPSRRISPRLSSMWRADLQRQ